MEEQTQKEKEKEIMYILKAIIIFSLVLSGCVHNITYASDKTNDLDYNKLYRSVVILSAVSPNGPSSGHVFATGFAYDENRIATAKHFCTDALEKQIFDKFILSAHQKIDGTITLIGDWEVDEMSEDKDVCLIRKDGHMIPSLKMTNNYNKNVEFGDDVIIIGAPGGLSIGIFKGIVLEKYHSGFGPAVISGLLVITAPSTGGISGSPIILNRTGEVIGVVVQSLRSFDHLTFGEPIMELIKIAK